MHTWYIFLTDQLLTVLECDNASRSSHTDTSIALDAVNYLFGGTSRIGGNAFLLVVSSSINGWIRALLVSSSLAICPITFCLSNRILSYQTSIDVNHVLFNFKLALTVYDQSNSVHRLISFSPASKIRRLGIQLAASTSFRVKLL